MGRDHRIRDSRARSQSALRSRGLSRSPAAGGRALSLDAATPPARVVVRQEPGALPRVRTRRVALGDRQGRLSRRTLRHRQHLGVGRRAAPALAPRVPQSHAGRVQAEVR